MFSNNEHMISNAIDIISNSDIADNLEGQKFYGSYKNMQKINQYCKIFHISNETGNGDITAYQVFKGIELYFNDMHLAYCNQKQETAKNVIEINHCLIGRFECSFGEHSCCYMSSGDLAICSSMRRKSSPCFPLSHYHGISIIINLEAIPTEIKELLKLFNIDLSHIQEYVCEENRCCIMRANPSIEHIFSELYDMRKTSELGYMRVKVLELLLFISDLQADKEIIQTNYINKAQVSLIKSIASFMTADLTVHHTIDEIARKFEISPSALKKTFKSVYGISVYAYLKTFRLQVAQKLLVETNLPITTIATMIGYENPNKLSSSFRDMYGLSPLSFRKGVLLDRYQPLWSGGKK